MKRLLIILGNLVLILGILVLRPINTSKSNSDTITGKVKFVYEAGVKDACFKLEEDPHTYYINRGLENSLNLEHLKDLLEGKEIKLHFARHWTPLDSKTINKHVTQLEFSGDTLFSEF